MALYPKQPVTAALFNTEFLSKVDDSTAAGKITLSNTTQSTTKDTGCLILEGGLGVEKNINSGGIIKATTSLDTGSTTSISDTLANITNLLINNKLRGAITTDSSTTGATASIAAPSTMYLRLTNVGLTGVSKFTTPSNGQLFVLVNITGAALLLKNTDAASDDILTGSGLDLSVPNNSSALLWYDTTSIRWRVLSGGGGGGSLVNISSLALTASAAIAINTSATEQVILVSSSSGDAVLSTTPFGTSPPSDGATLELIGNDDSNTVTISFNDAANGCVGNFSSITLAKYQVAKFRYNSTQSRYVLCSKS